MKLTKSLFAKTFAAGMLAFAAQASHANIVLMNPESFGGSGLGAVNTILTIQNTDTETGAVSFNGTEDVITGDAKKGNSQTLTRTIGQLGILSASGLRIVFNATEPDNLISLTGLTLSFYNTAGLALYTADLDRAYLNLSTESGIGNSGFVFGLDSIQAAEAQAAVFSMANFNTVRIGLAATATGSAGGNETFFVSQTSTGGGGGSTQIPEPASLALFGLGIAAASLARRRRRA